jgi:putative IMPACT (imprinted ancient) family translation regulator
LLPDADRPLELASDAGEPPGTAGRPILLALSGAGLVNCVLVVSRWFGGTKLGRGGLARAYGLAARAAVDAATLAPVRRMRRVEVCAPFGDAGLVAAVAARAGARVEALEPQAVYRAMLLVPEERWSELVGALANATGGRASAMPGERVLGLGEPGDPAGRLTPPRRRGKLGA